MTKAMLAMLAAAALLGGCMHGMHGDHAHGAMADCPMMREHHQAHAPGAAGHAEGHEGMDHSNMSHEEMMRHCEMMRQQHQGTQSEQPPAETPHQHQH